MPPLIRPEDESLKVVRLDAISAAKRAAEEAKLSAEEAKLSEERNQAIADRDRAAHLIETQASYFESILEELIESYRANYIGEETLARVGRDSRKGDFTFGLAIAQNRESSDLYHRNESRSKLYGPALSRILAEKVAAMIDDDPSRIVISVGASTEGGGGGIQGEPWSGSDFDSYSINTFTLSYKH